MLLSAGNYLTNIPRRMVLPAVGVPMEATDHAPRAPAPRAIKLRGPDLERFIRRIQAVELYREGRRSLCKAKEVAGAQEQECTGSTDRRGIPSFRYRRRPCTQAAVSFLPIGTDFCHVEMTRGPRIAVRMAGQRRSADDRAMRRVDHPGRDIHKTRGREGRPSTGPERSPPKPPSPPAAIPV